MPTDWYERRHELEPGMVFRTQDDSLVQLDRGVPGDATRWYVLNGDGNGRWSCYDDTIEPGDLKELIAEDEQCAKGMHSWIYERGKLGFYETCTRCGELYGNPD
jgi:hypothetical protein